MIRDRGRIRTYRPAEEEIFLKPESQLKFTDEIFRVPSSAIELTLHWLEVDLIKVELKVTLFLYFEQPSTLSFITWVFEDDPKNPTCTITCLNGRTIYSLEENEHDLLVDRLEMLITHFPQPLRKLILEPLKRLRKNPKPDPKAKVKVVSESAASNGNKNNISTNGHKLGKRVVQLS